MNFDYKSVAAIALCILFYLGYSHYLSTKYPDYNKPKVEQVQNSPGGASAPSAAPGATALAPASTVAKLAPEQLVIETDTTVYKFNQEIGGLESVVLKSYKVDKKPDSPPINLLDSPLVLQGTTDVMSFKQAVGDFSAERPASSPRTIVFTRLTPTFKIAQEFTIPEKGFGAKLKVTFTNVSGTVIDLIGGVLTKETVKYKSQKTLGFIPGTVTERDHMVYYDDSIQLTDIENFCKDDQDPISVQNRAIDFLGFDKHYFLNVLQPKAKQLSLKIEKTGKTETDCAVALLAYDKLGAIQPNDSVSLDFDAYMGPKDFEILKSYDPKLQNSVDLGIFAVIARPLLAIIEGFKNVTGNYGIAIILLTIALKMLFYPLMRASSKSMHAMKKLNPQMNAIREKFKDDRQRQQQELMKFMSANKINPMKGCLPMLPQIPVFFAFYRVLQTSIQLRHAPFYGWIQDLSYMDPFFVTPILMGIAMLVQQKLTPTTGMDKTQEKIMMFMPVMFTFMMVTLPAGLTLYMLTNTTVGILQQRWLYHRLDQQKN